MSLSRKRTQFLAYVGGLFDGEGTVGIYPIHKGRDGDFSMKVAIAMTEPASVALIKAEFPECRISIRKRLVGHHQFVVTFNALHGYDFLKAIEPYVIIKWEQVKVALTFSAHKRQMMHSKKHHPCTHCQWAADTIEALKTPDSNGVKTVELLRRHGLRQYRAKAEEVDQDCARVAQLLKDLLQRVETRLMPSTGYKAMSAPEKDIVQAVA